jgi:hypothetical protein
MHSAIIQKLIWGGSRNVTNFFPDIVIFFVEKMCGFIRKNSTGTTVVLLVPVLFIVPIVLELSTNTTTRTGYEYSEYSFSKGFTTSTTSKNDSEKDHFSSSHQYLFYINYFLLLGTSSNYPE